MKKITIFILLIVAITSCKKSNNTLSNKSTNNNSTTNTQTPMNNVGMAETTLTGHWDFDSIVNYNNNVGQTLYPSTTGFQDAVYDLYNTAYSTSSVYAGYKNISYATPPNPATAGFWYVSDNHLALSGYLELTTQGPPYLNGFIAALSVNNLVITGASPTLVKQGMYYYFHK